MELARAAGWQLLSCSGNNNSCCPPAHLSSIRPDPIPIQFQIQSGQWLARLGQIESDSRIRAAHRRDAEAIFHAIWSNACGVSAFTRSVVASSGAWSDRQSSQSPSRPFPASSSSAPRLRRWPASARRCGGSTSPSTTGSSSSDGPLPPRCVLLCSSWVPDGSSSSCCSDLVFLWSWDALQGAGAVLCGPDAAGERAQGRLRRRREASTVRADSSHYGGQLFLFPPPFLFSKYFGSALQFVLSQ